MKLEDFMKKNKPLKKVSVLQPFREEINTLLENNYTQEQILEYLKLSKKIQVTRFSLGRFLKKDRKTQFKKEVQKTSPKIKQNTKNDPFSMLDQVFGNNP